MSEVIKTSELGKNSWEPVLYIVTAFSPGFIGNLEHNLSCLPHCANLTETKRTLQRVLNVTKMELGDLGRVVGTSALHSTGFRSELEPLGRINGT